MTQNFDSFIEKLGRETVAAINKERKITQPKKESVVVAPTKITIAPDALRPQIVLSEEKKEEQKKEPLSEDFVEKALDYAKIIIKTVRKTFENEDERKKVFEAIRNTVNLFLEEEKPQTVYTTTYPGQQIGTGGVSVPSNHSLTAAMTEEEWNRVPEIQEAEADIPLESMPAAVSKPMPTNNAAYSRDLKIALKEGKDGKKEVDLSQISPKDINDIKVLAGIQ